MFDSSLLQEVASADSVFWAGKTPPVERFVCSELLFDHERDFRLAPHQHGAHSVVYLTEYDLGIFKQWPLILDEALRLFKHGQAGILFVRFSENPRFSVFAFAAFLRRRADFRCELIFQERDLSTGMTVFGVRCEREVDVPHLTSFDFGLITDGRKEAAVQAFIQSVHQIEGIERIDWRILISGPESILPSLQAFGGKVVFVPEPSEHASQGWITRKKNLIVSASAASNLLLAHDRFVVPPSFLNDMFEFGADFSVLTPAQFDRSGRRCPDWVATSTAWSWGPIGMMAYGDYSPHAYVNGGVLIAKRQVLQHTPWNELLFWSQAEDVELTRCLEEHGVTPRLARSVRVTVADARPGYDFEFVRLPFLPHHYPVAAADGAWATAPRFQSGQWLPLQGQDAAQLVPHGLVVSDREWVSSAQGLVSASAEVELNLNGTWHRECRIEIDFAVGSLPADVQLSVNHQAMPLTWHQRQDKGFLMVAVLPPLMVADAQVVVLRFTLARGVVLERMGLFEVLPPQPVVKRRGPLRRWWKRVRERARRRNP